DHSTATIAPELATCIARSLGLRSVRLTGPTPRRTIGIVSAKGASLSAAARAFADLSRAVVRKIRTS
ncbi:MAG: hypothetical protein ACRD2J_06300, partial [Thermoanaerobaculia bacterium]